MQTLTFKDKSIDEIIKHLIKSKEKLNIEQKNFYDMGKSIDQCFRLCETVIRYDHTLCFKDYPGILIWRDMSALELTKFYSFVRHNLLSQVMKKTMRRRLDEGLHVGRPAGHMNKSLKLDNHHDQIVKWREEGISKASIAKLLSVHPQTLYDYLKRRSIK